MRLDLRTAARNPVSLVGAAITTAAAVVFLALLILELAGQLHNPYMGLMLFIAVPAVFVFGLLLIPIGIHRQRRRVLAGAPDEWPVIDMRLPHTRSLVFGVALLTFVNVLIVSLAAFGSLHHMESKEFCGTTCHTTMEPEWKAHQVSNHAEVDCVACHVGSGAQALVESKVSGTRQLWHVMTNSVTAPVPTPVHSMRPARETCQTCHWAEKMHGDKLKMVREYADDEASSETVTTLQLHVGGGREAFGSGNGIHWHMNIDNKIEFVSDDKRETIPYVKFTDRSGAVKEFVVDGTTPDQIAKGERRTMDCLDCHNRPAHTFEPSPERAVDVAIANGHLPKTLPFARREAVAALKDDYSSGDEAQRGIDTRLRKAFAAKSGDPDLPRTIAAVQDIYGSNVFPAMKVKWGTYPNNIGHTFFNGCFRCHDDNHKAKDGTVIKQDCETCHAMP